MDTTDEPAYSLRHRATGDDLTVREGDEVESEDGVFEIRMPIASSGEVRNDGDEPLTRGELSGMAQQINSRQIGVFPAHGADSTIASGHYSPFERMGDWQNGELVERGDMDLLMATARMPDPETLPAATGAYREGLAILKEQAKRGIAQDSSIGWRDDDSFPGGVDLMEASIVGIGADPRTNTGDKNAEVVARAAVEAGADPDDLVTRVRSAVERATDTVEGTEIDVTPPEAVVNAAEAAKAAKEEYADEIGDCGTGDGMESARKIVDDDLTAEYVADEIAAYLSSHEEDVDGIDSPPTDWGKEEWLGTYDSDEPRCGPVQYALWGGTATGTGLDWATGIANDVADAKGEDQPYPDRSTDTEDTDDMTDDSETTDTDDVQTAPDDGGEQTRAPEDVSEDDLLTFTARHFDGMDEGDLMQAVDAADGEYIGECDPEALYDFVSIVTGAEYGTVEDAMADLMDSDDGDTDDEQEGDKPDDYDEDGDDEDDERALEDRLDALESDLEALRSGEIEASEATDTPETDGEQDADEPETDEEQNADSDTDTDDSGGDSEPTDTHDADPTQGLGDFRHN